MSRLRKLESVWKQLFAPSRGAFPLLFKEATYKILHYIQILISPGTFRPMHINSLVEQRREVLLNRGFGPITQNRTNTGSDPKPIFSVKKKFHPENQHNIWAAHKPISVSLEVRVEDCASSPEQRWEAVRAGSFCSTNKTRAV